MRLHIVDGIVYTKIGDHEIYSQELIQNEQLTGYLKSNMLTSTATVSKEQFFLTIRR